MNIHACSPPNQIGATQARFARRVRQITDIAVPACDLPLPAAQLRPYLAKKPATIWLNRSGHSICTAWAQPGTTANWQLPMPCHSARTCAQG